MDIIQNETEAKEKEKEKEKTSSPRSPSMSKKVNYWVFLMFLLVPPFCSLPPPSPSPSPSSSFLLLLLLFLLLCKDYFGDSLTFFFSVQGHAKKTTEKNKVRASLSLSKFGTFRKAQLETTIKKGTAIHNILHKEMLRNEFVKGTSWQWKSVGNEKGEVR